MSDSLSQRVACAAAQVDLTAPTNPADNDFDGFCIQCLQENSRPLTLFKDQEPQTCDAFCSFECAELFAFEMANFGDPGEIIVSTSCPHDIPDGQWCNRCANEIVKQANAGRKSGAV